MGHKKGSNFPWKLNLYHQSSLRELRTLWCWVFLFDNVPGISLNMMRCMLVDSFYQAQFDFALLCVFENICMHLYAVFSTSLLKCRRLRLCSLKQKYQS